MQQRLTVIGNISRDRTHYPDGRHGLRLGGAALHVSLAAARAGAIVGPVSVIGTDLDGIRGDPGLADLDTTGVRTARGPSAAFDLRYDADDRLVEITCFYGVAEQLTDHALGELGRHPRSWCHLSCRRPLDVAPVLRTLTDRGAAFSVDFLLSSAGELITAAARWLPHAQTVFTNVAEYRILADAIDISTLKALVITDGPGPIRLVRHGKVISTTRPPPSTPVEVTGAGDTFAGTFLAHRLAGQDEAFSLRAAAVAAAAHTSGPLLAHGAPHRS